MLAAACLLLTVAAWGQIPPPESASACGAGAGAFVATVGSQVRPPSFMKDSFAQLKAEVPELRGLRFEARQGSDFFDGADESATILAQTGETLLAMLPRVPHLIAKEELTQVAVPLPYTVGEGRQSASLGGGRRGGAVMGYSSSERGLEGDELRRAMDTLLANSGHPALFGYRIQSDQDPKLGFILNEYRTNGKNEELDRTHPEQGGPKGIGFGNAWMMFLPQNQEQARFRYLGRQKLGKVETFVVAFAQVPEHVRLPGQISIGGTNCRYYSQGIVWIDQSNFQVMRLHSDLLQALPDIHLVTLRSELTIGEIRIPEKNLSLWMPKDVVLSWQTTEQSAEERHRYSNYRLLTATSRIILP